MISITTQASVAVQLDEPDSKITIMPLFVEHQRKAYEFTIDEGGRTRSIQLKSIDIANLAKALQKLAEIDRHNNVEA